MACLWVHVCLIKPENINVVLNAINSFHPNIQFTVDTFEDDEVHFLDLRISNNLDIDVYRKDTFTGQYTRYDSIEPWHYKIGWARSIFSRCQKLCSKKEAFHNQINMLKKFFCME